jgi:hypothetical protein
MGNIGEIRTHACHVALLEGPASLSVQGARGSGRERTDEEHESGKVSSCGQRRQPMPCCRRHCRPTLRRNAAVTTTRAELDQAAKLSSHRIHLTAD